jgi:hypothetical protein
MEAAIATMTKVIPEEMVLPPASSERKDIPYPFENLLCQFTWQLSFTAAFKLDVPGTHIWTSSRVEHTYLLRVNLEKIDHQIAADARATLAFQNIAPRIEHCYPSRPFGGHRLN